MYALVQNVHAPLRATLQLVDLDAARAGCMRAGTMTKPVVEAGVVVGRRAGATGGGGRGEGCEVAHEGQVPLLGEECGGAEGGCSERAGKGVGR